MSQQRTTRRSVLTPIVGAALTGCGIAATPAAAPAYAPPPSAAPPGDPDLVVLERRFGGRIGVRALDTGNGAAVSHRSGQRFLTASTAKLPLTVAVLDRAATEPSLLDRLVRYGPEELPEYAP